jgi:hypothetical protein
MTPDRSDSRDLLLLWVRADDGETWLEQTVDLAATDATFLGESRADVHARAAEYRGQVAEQRVRVPSPDGFSEPPVIDAEVVG